LPTTELNQPSPGNPHRRNRLPEQGFRTCKNSDLTQGTNSVHSYGQPLFTLPIPGETYSDTSLQLRRQFTVFQTKSSSSTRFGISFALDSRTKLWVLIEVNGRFYPGPTPTTINGL
jgi:hypothetical protein